VSAEREEAIEGIMAKVGKTREQAEAFLDILGSAMRRRSWIEGEPLEQSEIGAKLDTFMGLTPSAEEDVEP
jgi:NADH:ubiquinone oxidoreductase subunit E